MNKTVARMLGEAVPGAPDEAALSDVEGGSAEGGGEGGEQVAANAEQAAPPQIDYSNPTVQQLVELWQSGNHEAVALRVLDALDMYADFLELAFQIGHDDAITLGTIMDTMTSTERSPHYFDVMSDVAIQKKYPKGVGIPSPEIRHAAHE